MNKNEKIIDDNNLNLLEFINVRPVSKFQYLVVFLCFLVAMVDGFDTQAVAFVAPIVSKSMGFGAQGIGNLYSAGLIGLMLGALCFSPLADRIGRKPVVIISCLLMGIFSLLSATSENLNQLIAYRFLTGLGLGAAMPNINALTAEYSPKRHQALLMTLMFAGFPFGAVLGGLISVNLIAAYGWASVFVLGGGMPLILVVIIFKALPESLKYRAVRNTKDNTIGVILNKIDNTYQFVPGTSFTIEENGTAHRVKRNPVFELFADGRASTTLVIWMIYFANLLMMYSLLGWLPTLMSVTALGLAGGIYAAVSFNVGGILGGLVLSWLLDNKYGNLPIAVGYIIATISVFLISTLGQNFILALFIVALSGVALMGGAFAMNAVSASYYPTSVRATGLGWALAIGRLGAIFGPVAIGMAISSNISIVNIYMALAIPGIICAVAVLWLERKHKPG